MKKEFVKPEVKIAEIEKCNVIATSNQGGGGQGCENYQDLGGL